MYLRTVHKLLFSSSQAELLTLVLVLQLSNIHVLIRDAGFKTVLSNITIIHAASVLCLSCIPERVGII